VTAAPKTLVVGGPYDGQYWEQHRIDGKLLDPLVAPHPEALRTRGAIQGHVYHLTSVAVFGKVLEVYRHSEIPRRRLDAMLPELLLNKASLENWMAADWAPIADEPEKP
jgi:hypothetical protein